ncbi:hypothetical protein [Salinisphaera sp. LB1]|uniref:hypothetical protein n=1 Tax=Salinisphaera sp. LB1 TaxID=2183911 RepID=UPI000D707D9A|nr:hypothetical protein [Salinisphaera sp. LB1]AWN17754.1 hypothetical protein SALB1_3562 [Salinisphaera sp. LB1]
MIGSNHVTRAQKRWRENSGKKRIEVYLPVDTLAMLDGLASERGLSRAGVIAQLISDQRQAAPTEARSKGYSWRKATSSDDFDWLVIVDGEPIAGVKRDDVNGWRGKYLQGSMAYKWAKGKTRDKVAFDLLDAPYIYR